MAPDTRRTRRGGPHRSGCPTPDDPQTAFGCETNGLPQVHDIQQIADGEVVKRYADGPNPVSADGFRFTPIAGTFKASNQSKSATRKATDHARRGEIKTVVTLISLYAARNG